MDPRVRETKVAGIGLQDAERWLERNVTGRKTIGGGVVRAGAELVKPAARDIVTLPQNVVLGTYYTGRAGLKAVQGDTREAKQLWEDFKDTDPIALAVQGRWKEAAASTAEHPVSTLLEVAGPVKGGSGLAGKAGRRRDVSRRVPGTNVREVRREPKGLVGRYASRGAYAARLRRSQRLQRRADEAYERAEVPKAEALEKQALRADPRRVPDREIEHQVDVVAEGLAQSVRRPHRSQTAQELRGALGYRRGRPQRGSEAISLLAQAVAKGDKADLRALVVRLDEERSRLPAAKQKANRKMAGQIRKVLQGKADLDSLKGAARQYAAVVNRLERDLVSARMLDPKEAEKAKLKAYAVRYMDADDDGQRLVVPRSKSDKRHPARLVRGTWVRARDRDNVGQIVSVDGKRAKVRFVNAKQGTEATVTLPLNSLRRTVKEERYRPLSTAEIKGHMRRNGVDPDEVAFVSHQPRQSGSGAFNVSGRKAQGIGGRRRTGRAVSEGLLDLDPERLVEQGVRMRGLSDANNTWKRFVSHFAYRDDKGRLQTRETRGRADALARDLAASTGREWAVIRLSPWQGKQSQLDELVRKADAEGYVAEGGRTVHPVSRAIEEAASGSGGPEGPWAVVPQAAANRMAEHAKVYSGSGPTARAITQGFRRTVLPMSASWLTGNLLEGTLRVAVAGAGPRSWLTFRRGYNQLAVGDPSIRRALTRKLPDPTPGSPAEQLLHMVPGGHYGGTHESMIHVSSQQFEGKRIEPIARAMSAVYRKPGPGTLARAYRTYSDWVFGSFNAGIEAQFTRAIAGRHMRKEHMSRKDRQTLETAVEQAARGVTGTPEQIRMGDVVRRAYGQYDSQSPQVRRWILTYTPFGMWTWNAAKFLFSVLPRDHPMLTSVLAAQHQLSEDWRKEQGLDQYALDPVPPFLQGAVPIPGGGHLRVARYTPFGLMGDPMTTVATNVLPQFSGPLMAFRGLDWKGEPLKGKDGKEVTDPWALAMIGAREFAFGTVPGIGIGLRAVEQGPENVFNPFRPVKPSEDQAEKGPAEEILEKHGVPTGGSDTAEEILKKHGLLK